MKMTERDHDAERRDTERRDAERRDAGRRDADRSSAGQGGPAPARRKPGGRTSTSWLAVVVLGFGLGAGLGSTASAQPRRGGNSAPAERRDAGGPTGKAERREQIKKKIRAIRAYTLTEALSLDEATAGRLFPMLARYDDETDKLLEKRVDVQRRLRHADSLRDPKAVERLIDEAIAVQRGFWDLEDKRVADLRKILTPGQTAKLLVVLPALEHKIQNQLRKVIAQRRPGGNAAGGADASAAGSGDDSDDDQEPDEVGPAPPPRGPLRRREAPMAPRPGPSNAPGNTPPCNPNTEPCR